MTDKMDRGLDEIIADTVRSLISASGAALRRVSPSATRLTTPTA